MAEAEQPERSGEVLDGGTVGVVVTPTEVRPPERNADVASAGHGAAEPLLEGLGYAEGSCHDPGQHGSLTVEDVASHLHHTACPSAPGEVQHRLPNRCTGMTDHQGRVVDSQPVRDLAAVPNDHSGRGQPLGPAGRQRGVDVELDVHTPEKGLS